MDYVEILKIIGIVIVYIVMIALVLLCLVLFVPVRYKIFAKKYEKTDAYLKINWLFRIVSLKVGYKKGKEYYRLRVLGIPFKLNKANGKLRKKDKVKKDKIKKEKAKKIKKEKVKNKKARNKNITDNEDKNITVSDNSNTNSEASDVSLSNKDTTSNNLITNTEKSSVSNTVNEDNVEEKETKISLKKEESTNKTSKKEKKVKNKKIKIFKKIKLTAVKTYKKASKVKEFLQEKSTKRGLKVLKKYSIKILKHIKPKVCKANIRFGFEQPDKTGKLLACIGSVYAWISCNVDEKYVDNVVIKPDFSEEVLEGFVNIKGRLMISVLLVNLLKLMNDNAFSRAKYNFKKNILS